MSNKKAVFCWRTHHDRWSRVHLIRCLCTAVATDIPAHHDNYRKPAILLTFQESEVCLRMMSKLGGICKERLAKRQNGNIKSILQPRCLYFVCDAHFFAVLEMNIFELWAQTQHVCLNLQKRKWFCVACHQFISVESWRIARYCKILQVQVLCLVFIEYSRKCVIPKEHDKWACTAGLHGWSNEMHPLNCIEDSVHTALHRTYKVRHQSRVVPLTLSWPT